MVFVLPPKSQVGYLSPDVAGEGTKVITSEGDQVTWDILPPKPNFPDMSGIKSIARYFAPRPYKAFPAWVFYHPKAGESPEPDRLVKNEHEAADLGVCYREETADERGRFGVSNVWDYTEETCWRARPYAKPKFDPKSPSHAGKNVVEAAVNPVHAQHALLAEMVPAVTAAVVKAMQGNAAPSSVDPAQWAEFVKFQAWQKTQEAVNILSAPEAQPSEVAGLSQDELLVELSKIAAEKGIKVKKSWSIDDIKAALDKAA